MKRARSVALRKARSWPPPAKTVSGRPARACWTKVGITNPPARDWRGPPTLNGRMTKPLQAAVAAVDRRRLGQRLGDRVLEARVVVHRDDDVVGLGEHPAAAVDLGGAEGDQGDVVLDALLDDLLRGGDDLRAEVALVLEDARGADVARGVDHEVGVLEASALREVVGDRDAVHARARLVLAPVGDRGDHRIDDRDLAPIRQQRVDDVRADEPEPACDYDLLHPCSRHTAVFRSTYNMRRQ